LSRVYLFTVTDGVQLRDAEVRMTVQTFRELLSQRPFRPFRLVMFSGQSYEVRHPEMAMLTRTDLLVGVGESEEGVPAEFRICSLLHVATVEPIATGGTGQG
jgi:hypothetical protein